MGRLEGVSPEDYPARRHSLFVQGPSAATRARTSDAQSPQGPAADTMCLKSFAAELRRYQLH